MDILLLEEDSCIDDLLPFTSTRSVLDIRMGILTFREKWAHLLGPAGFTPAPSPQDVALPANLLPTRQLAAIIRGELSAGPLTQAAADRITATARIIRYP